MHVNKRATQKAQGRNPTPRSEKTRLEVIEAAALCISEEGYADASTNRIAERANVSWGVLQYHFGDKAGLMSAVLEHGIKAMEEGLSSITKRGLPDGSVEQRLRSFFDQGWVLHSSPLSRAGVEVVINNRKTMSDNPTQSEYLLSVERKIYQLTLDAMLLVVDNSELAANLTHVYLIALRGLESHLLQHHGDPKFSTEREAILNMMLTWIQTNTELNA